MLGDVPACLRLSAEAGWNQVAADWRLILTVGRGVGIFDAARLVATAAVVPHGTRLGWICMVLVTEDVRRQGLATRLMRWAIDALEAEGRVAGLDATPAGREVYRRLGFGGGTTITRFLAERVEGRVFDPGAARPLTPEDLAAVSAYDARVFGAKRGAIVTALHGRRPDLAAVTEAAGKVTGYVVARDGSFATHLGPLVADDETTARALLSHVLARAGGPVLIDVIDRHAGVHDWLCRRGFVAQRGFTRMLKGTFQDSRYARMVAIAGPELG